MKGGGAADFHLREFGVPVWIIVEPITIAVEYSYPNQKTPQSKDKFSSKNQETIEKPIVELAQLQEQIKTLVVGEGRLRSSSSQTPYGWILDHGSLKPLAVEMQLVTYMEAMRAQDESLHAIARALNEKQVPAKNKGRWHAKTVAQVLKFNKRKS